MSQSGLLDRSREADWAAWYVEHLRIMRTVTGIDSAERFVTDAIGWPPSLAMYSIASAAVFDDPYYQKIRGMGEWLPLIDRRFYRRNLFEGLEVAPVVPPGSVLAVCDRTEARLPGSDIDFHWLRAVALDRSTPYRGIAVLSAGEADGLRPAEAIAIYLPSNVARTNR